MSFEYKANLTYEFWAVPLQYFLSESSQDRRCLRGKRGHEMTRMGNEFFSRLKAAQYY